MNRRMHTRSMARDSETDAGRGRGWTDGAAGQRISEQVNDDRGRALGFKGQNAVAGFLVKPGLGHEGET